MKKPFNACKSALLPTLVFSLFFSLFIFSIARADDGVSQSNSSDVISEVTFPNTPTIPRIIPPLLPVFSEIITMLHPPAAQVGLALLATKDDFTRDIAKPFEHAPSEAMTLSAIPLKALKSVATREIGKVADAYNRKFAYIQQQISKTIDSPSAASNQASVSSSGIMVDLSNKINDKVTSMLSKISSQI